MERQRITAEVAFGYLSQASQDVNMKLTAVARHLVDTGELLSAADPGAVTRAGQLSPAHASPPAQTVAGRSGRSGGDHGYADPAAVDVDHGPVHEA